MEDYSRIFLALADVQDGVNELVQDLEEHAQTLAPTCRCGMWPIEEYGPICPSCDLEEE